MFYTLGYILQTSPPTLYHWTHMDLIMIYIILRDLVLLDKDDFFKINTTYMQPYILEVMV